MSVMHYKHDFNYTSEPLCKRVAACIARGTLKVDNVTCKRCLKLLEKEVNRIASPSGLREWNV
jgi:hypothetical protein